MGGIGSGRRWHYGAKDTTEDSRPLDIRKLQRAGVLTPGRWFGWQWTINHEPVSSINARVEIDRVVLVYRYRRRCDADWQDVEQPVYLDCTACTYGGTRPWWLCPSCSRRVAILYSTGKFYACRHCCQLAYTCQRETAGDRAARRADTIRRQLGWPAGILNSAGDKPKGMRWSTYERLRDKEEHYKMLGLAGIAAWLKASRGSAR